MTSTYKLNQLNNAINSMQLNKIRINIINHQLAPVFRPGHTGRQDWCLVNSLFQSNVYRSTTGIACSPIRQLTEEEGFIAGI